MNELLQKINLIGVTRRVPWIVPDVENNVYCVFKKVSIKNKNANNLFQEKGYRLLQAVVCTGYIADS